LDVNEISSAAAMNPGGNFQGTLFDMLVHAGFVVQLVLALLLLFSVISWAIILMKYVSLRKVRKENDLFMNAYMKSAKLSDIFPEAKKLKYSTLAEVLRRSPRRLAQTTPISPVRFRRSAGSTMWSGR
jgi:biopolymer transport protein TolQ